MIDTRSSVVSVQQRRGTWVFPLSATCRLSDDGKIIPSFYFSGGLVSSAGSEWVITLLNEARRAHHHLWLMSGRLPPEGVLEAAYSARAGDDPDKPWKTSTVVSTRITRCIITRSRCLFWSLRNPYIDHSTEFVPNSGQVVAVEGPSGNMQCEHARISRRAIAA